MKKLLGLTLAVMMASTHAHALTMSQFVGDWRCTTQFGFNDGSQERTVTLDTMNADGSMSQLWEVVGRDAKGRLAGVEHFSIKNRWSVKGDKLRIFDFDLVEYVSYDRDKLPYHDEAQAELKGYWVELYQEPYDSKVKFIDKDTMIFPQDDGTSNTTCVRLTPNGAMS